MISIKYDIDNNELHIFDSFNDYRGDISAEDVEEYIRMLEDIEKNRAPRAGYSSDSYSTAGGIVFGEYDFKQGYFGNWIKVERCGNIIKRLKSTPYYKFSIKENKDESCRNYLLRIYGYKRFYPERIKEKMYEQSLSHLIKVVSVINKKKGSRDETNR